MAIEATKLQNLARLGHLQALATKTETELAKLRTIGGNAIKSVSVSGNTISFFRSLEAGATADFTVDFPTEMFLDQAQTQFVNNFTFNAATYPGATDPNLNGKPVLVLAVKTTDSQKTTQSAINYSFLDVSTLVDTYSPASGETAISVSGYELTINVSNTANNALTKDAGGLFVDISGKADKVSSATNGDLASLDASGNLVDSGIAAANVLTTANIAPDADVTEMMNDIWPAAGGGE